MLGRVPYSWPAGSNPSALYRAATVQASGTLPTPTWKKKTWRPEKGEEGTSDERMIYAAQIRCMYALLANEQEGCSGCAAWCWGVGAEGKRQGMFNRLV